jgi:hypothetical protein
MGGVVDAHSYEDRFIYQKNKECGPLGSSALPLCQLLFRKFL